MDHSIALFLIVAVIVLALALGLFEDLGAAWSQLRAGAVPLDDGCRTMVSPMGVRLTNVEPSQQPCLVAAGWLPEGHPDAGAASRAYVRQSPGHRNFGIPRGGYADVAFHSPLESKRWTGDDLLVPGEARPL